MPKYAEIKDSIITNVFLAEADFIAEHKPEAIECPEGFGVGDKYEDGEFLRVLIVVVDETETI
jgi:hypothetical protein